MRLQNKVSLITGAASGIGKATAILFAKEGAKVAAADINVEGGEQTVEKIKDNGGEAIFVKADVTKDVDIKKLVEKTIQTYGKIDIVCNIAGIITLGKITTLTEEDWDKCMAVNVKGIFLVCRHVIPEMARQGGGSIINVSSGAGIIGSPNSAVYCASKGAVLNLSKAMAIDHAHENIRVNAICPGVTDTPANDMVVAASDNPEKARKETDKVILLGRIADPQEIAYGMLFLASDESSYVTGSALVVDGGITAR